MHQLYHSSTLLCSVYRFSTRTCPVASPRGMTILPKRPSLILGQVWNGGFFKRTSLNDLGHCFYIGHQYTTCPSESRTQVVLVIDTNGVHHVNVQFCACTEDAQWVEKYRQLLRVGWYPASFQRPKTVFTFDVLDTYHKLTLQGKLNLYDFYSSILQTAVVTKFYVKPSTILTHYDAKIMVSHVATDQL